MEVLAVGKVTNHRLTRKIRKLHLKIKNKDFKSLCHDLNITGRAITDN